MIVKKLIFLNKFLLLIFLFIFSFNNIGHTYVGLGPLIPVLGSILVWLFVAIISVFGFIVYPIKKILDKTKNKKKSQKQT